MLNAPHITRLHDLATAHWHDAATPAPVPSTAFERLVLDQHRANFDLWHCEDAARDPSAPDAAIVRAKRSIDTFNQLRNDLIESIDVFLLDAASALLQASPAPPATAPLHSETPGLMIDRLSILALKLFHTEEETRRPNASAAHHQRNRDRLALLTRQRYDLSACLDGLWSDVLANRRRFQLYRQLKMYNDPELNPVLYNNPAGAPR